MSSLLLLNGSPRGSRSNSMRMMGHIAAGWQAAGGEEPLVLHLAKRADFARAVEEYTPAETVLLGMPLYTDSMPGLVSEFIEALEPYVGREGNPRVGFLVQSGFSEALHSRGLERYLAKLAGRLGGGYAETAVRGGGEAWQMMPDKMVRKQIAQLETLGGELARDGRFSAETLEEFAGKERFSAAEAGLVALLSMTPLEQFYWNGMLRKNRVFAERFNAPYAPAAMR